MPAWLLPSLAGKDKDQKARLCAVFKKAIKDADGPDSVFLRAVDSDDTRHALDEVAEYDAFKDGFLVLPTLESMCVPPLFALVVPERTGADEPRVPSRATLPGEEDIDGLK